MERYGWKARVLPGMLEEYKRRHAEIWPEMLVQNGENGPVFRPALPSSWKNGSVRGLRIWGNKTVDL